MRINNEEQLIIEKAVRERIPYVNLILAKVVFIFGVLTAFIWILFQYGFLDSNSNFIKIVIMILPVVYISVGSIAHVLRGEKRWIKYLITFCIAFFVFFLDIMSGFKAKMIFAIPLIFSMTYYSKNVAKFVGILNVCLLVLSNYINAFLYSQTGYLDLYTVHLKEPITVVINNDLMNSVILANPPSDNLFVTGLITIVIPNSIIIGVLTIIAIIIIEKNQKVILNVEKMSRERADKEAEVTEMKSKIMLSQIQPHFLFNALSSIVALCDIDPTLAKETTLNFTKYLRGNINSLSTKRIVPFSKELEHTKAYVEIEKVRYQDRLNVIYDIKVTDFEIPSLTFQPMVENAIKHGVAKREEGGIVKIRTFETEECFVVEIIDNGVGFDVKNIDTESGKHVGIMNVRQRLSSEINGKLVISSVIGKGTNTKILIPKPDDDEINE